MDSNANNRHHDLSSAWLRALVDSAADSIVTIDAAGRIIAFNPAALRTFGYRREEVIGHMMADKIIPPDQREAHARGMTRFLATGSPRIIGRWVEMEAMRADGGTFPVELNVISVGPDAGPVFTAYLRDISEHKQAIAVHKEAIAERHRHAANLKRTLLQTILAVSRTIELRDPYTAGHQRRVAHLAAAMGAEMGLADNVVEGLFFGALIHDIGKIAVPAEILSRPGKLQREDRIYIETHCRKGHEIVRSVNFPWPVAEIVLQHHERLDGTGYPLGLHGDDIRLEARIVSVADVVEALTSHRPYRPAYPLEDALTTVVDKSGVWFEPDAVTACLRLFAERDYRIDAADRGDLDWLTTLA